MMKNKHPTLWYELLLAALPASIVLFDHLLSLYNNMLSLGATNVYYIWFWGRYAYCLAFGILLALALHLEGQIPRRLLYPIQGLYILLLATFTYFFALNARTQATPYLAFLLLGAMAFRLVQTMRRPA